MSAASTHIPNGVPLRPDSRAGLLPHMSMTIELKWARLAGIVAMSMACVLATDKGTRGDDGTQRAMIAKWAGNYNTEGFLKDPAVRGELWKLLGSEMDHFIRNLNVRGGVDLSGETLSVNGNAPHQGTEEEAIACVTVLPVNTIVEAAIFSKGAVTIYARVNTYEDASICIKDWITLVNSHHIDRLKQPANVRMAAP
jgi:hypothetical protein